MDISLDVKPINLLIDNICSELLLFSPTTKPLSDCVNTDGNIFELLWRKNVISLFTLSAIREFVVPKSIPTENFFSIVILSLGSDICINAILLT